jgi:hypothetical protein
VQVPTKPLRLQALQAPSQALSQQTPSTHWPEVHGLDAAHAVPFAVFATQAVPSQ